MEIDLNKLPARDAHDLLASAIIPRPIAWVSSVNAQGHINEATEAGEAVAVAQLVTVALNVKCLDSTSLPQVLRRNRKTYYETRSATVRRNTQPIYIGFLARLVMSTILLVHIKGEVLETEKTIDPIKFDVIGRLSGGNRYCRMGSIFEI